jgi:hypothetical protein
VLTASPPHEPGPKHLGQFCVSFPVVTERGALEDEPPRVTGPGFGHEVQNHFHRKPEKGGRRGEVPEGLGRRIGRTCLAQGAGRVPRRLAANKRCYTFPTAPQAAQPSDGRVPRRGAGAVEQGCLLSSYPA